MEYKGEARIKWQLSFANTLLESWLNGVGTLVPYNRPKKKKIFGGAPMKEHSGGALQGKRMEHHRSQQVIN